MRIIAGSLKNMEIKAPKGSKTRPTSSKVREAIMSMLLPWLDEAVIIDIFAGSGGFGLEALSRGSSKVLFIEKDSGTCAILKSNISNAKNRDPGIECTVKKLDAFKLSEKLASEYLEPTIVWADPPYEIAKSWIEHYLSKNLMFPACNGCLVIECSSKDAQEIESLVNEHPMFDVVKVKKYGDTSIIVSSRG